MSLLGSNIEVDGVEPTILCRYPEKDHKKHRFPENAPFVLIVVFTCNPQFCFPEGAKIEYKNKEQRKPFFFTFCFTVECVSTYLNDFLEMDLVVTVQPSSIMNL